MLLLFCSPTFGSKFSSLSRQSTQDYASDIIGEIDMDQEMPSPARIRWLDAVNKVRAQLNEVCMFLILYYSHKPSKEG